jgi:hypothetical protein
MVATLVALGSLSAATTAGGEPELAALPTNRL